MSDSVAILALVISLAAFLISLRQTQVGERGLTLTAYGQAVQMLLDLKNLFAKDALFFKSQITGDLVPGDVPPRGAKTPLLPTIPPSMSDKPEYFLIFAGAVWRFAYIYGVAWRASHLGVSKSEAEALKREILLWMRGLPGFYAVYCCHTVPANVQNEEFFEFLETYVFTPEFIASKGWPEPPHRQPKPKLQPQKWDLSKDPPVGLTI